MPKRLGRPKNPRKNTVLRLPLAHVLSIARALKQRGFTDTRYGVVSRRVETLEKQDYLMKVSVEKTHVGSHASVYQMTPRAELALALSKTDFSKLVKEADYAQVTKILEAVTTTEYAH